MKYYALLLFAALTVIAVLISYPHIAGTISHPANPVAAEQDTGTALVLRELEQNTLAHTNAAFAYAGRHGYNTSFCLLADIGLPSGQNRLFVYDFSLRAITAAALVAHGSCNQAFLGKARFSNDQGCGCTAYGKYKIGGKYKGRFGMAYKLYGLDSTNSHAFERNIVLHSYYGVPETATYPTPICNSLGCVMVAPGFLKKIIPKIDSSRKPVLLWVFY